MSPSPLLRDVGSTTNVSAPSQARMQPQPPLPFPKGCGRLSLTRRRIRGGRKTRKGPMKWGARVLGYETQTTTVVVVCFRHPWGDTMPRTTTRTKRITMTATATGELRARQRRRRGKRRGSGQRRYEGSSAERRDEEKEGTNDAEEGRNEEGGAGAEMKRKNSNDAEEEGENNPEEEGNEEGGRRGGKRRPAKTMQRGRKRR